MKISKLFHTLYAFLMFLPVMVLPLFAININQKEVEPLTAQIEVTQVVDFNQLIKNGNFSDNTHFWTFSTGIVYSVNDNVLTFQVSSDTSNSVYQSVSTVGHKYYLSADVKTTSSTTQIDLFAWSGYRSIRTIATTQWQHLSNIFEKLPEFGAYNGIGFRDLRSSDWDSVQITNIMFIDLSQMFGIGNEPTKEQFELWYPNDYYEYTNGRKEILHFNTFDTLNNTDVGSQFLYSLYNPLHDYFNLPNYMNLGGLYDWFLANLFSGYNSPVYFIIFDLMIYWLAMSLLWLIFDVLMYVPSMIHKMLDKARME